MTGDTRLFTRDFCICTLVCFFYTLYFLIFYTGMTSYAEHRFGVDMAVSGLIASTFIVGDLIARLYVSPRLERFGKRNIVKYSFLFSTALCVLYPYMWDVPSMCVLRLLHGFTYGATSSAVNTLVAEIIPPSRRGEGMGYFMLSLSISSAIGPFLCMYLQDHGSFEDVFAVGTIASLLGLVFSFCMTKGRPRDPTYRVPKGVRNYFEKSALGMSLVLFVFYFSYSGVLSFVSPYGQTIGLSDFAEYFFVTLSMGTLFARMFLGKVYDVHGENMALIPTFLVFILGMVLLGTADNGWTLLLAGAMIGLNLAMMTSVGQAIVIKLSPPGRYAVAISTFNIAMDISYAIGPVANGSIIDILGYRGNYLVMAAVAGLSLSMYIVLHGRKVAGGGIAKGSR